MQVADKAAALWQGLDANQQRGLRFGCFPADVLRAAAAEGFDGHALCVALMDHALTTSDRDRVLKHAARLNRINVREPKERRT